MRFVPRLHVITDEALQPTHDHLTLAKMAYGGGARVVQLRDKRVRSTRELYEIAAAIREVAENRPLIVNDRADIAAAVGAGVHVGDDDLPALAARRLVGVDALVGVSASTLAALGEIDPAIVDYVGVGPVFGTASKPDAGDALGLEKLRALVSESPVPVIAIGGITLASVAGVMATGVHGIAVLSAIVCAADPTAATRAFVAAISECSS